MILFSTHSARHLASAMSLAQGASTIKQFNDGEIFARIDEHVQGKNIWLLAATQAPAENLLELFFLLDALQRAGAHIHLFITYFAYGRQVAAAPGEARSAQVISSILKNFTIKKIYVMHPHNALLHDFLPFIAVRDIDFFCRQAAYYDAVAAPDKGAFKLAQEVAKTCNKDLILLTKKRPDHDKVEIIAVEGQAQGKKILLVDDIISTGNTIVQAAHTLKKLGATHLAAAATHGIFSPGSYQLLEHSILEKISVTNTIAQKKHAKITVFDIKSFIEKILIS